VRLHVEDKAHLEIIEVGEELLSRAHQTAHAIEERIWKVMAAKGLTGPHPAEIRGPDCQGDGAAGREDGT
jgi:hypothetical protein